MTNICQIIGEFDFYLYIYKMWNVVREFFTACVYTSVTARQSVNLSEILMKKHIFTLILLWLAGMSLPAAAQIKLGVCTSVKNARLVKEAGGDYIEEGVSNFLMPLRSDAEFAENLALAKASPLPIYACISFFPREIRLTGPDRDHALALAYAETAFRRAQMIGVKRIVLGSSGSRSLPEGYDRETGEEELVELLRQMGPIAAKYDVVVALEPLNKAETNFINSVAEGVAIVKRVKHPNIQCLADIYHMLRENEGPEVLVRYKKYICHCHVAENKDRAVPGTNGEDLTPYYRALRKAGYEGGLSIEAGWIDFGKQVGTGIADLRENVLQ